MTTEQMMTYKNMAIAKHRHGNPLTLEETAYAMWDPKTSTKPMTTMGILKIEKKAMEKLRSSLSQLGIHGIDDLFENNREVGRPLCTKEN